MKPKKCRNKPFDQTGLVKNQWELSRGPVNLLVKRHVSTRQRKNLWTNTAKFGCRSHSALFEPPDPEFRQNSLKFFCSIQFGVFAENRIAPADLLAKIA
jgi:hypothetical protein